MRHAQRLQGIESTIFATMSALAVRTGAVNLGQGFPDEDGPTSVIAQAESAMRAGRNQYPPGHGTPELLDAVIAHQRGCYGLELDRSQVVATTGATEAIAAAVLGLVDPGDEVVMLEPYYDSYDAVVQLAGGVRRGVTLRAPEYRLDVDVLAAAITSRTKLILLNTPHNPTGTVLTREELEAVARVAIEHDLVVVSDEVYEHLTFDDAAHLPIATLPGMFERTVTISSVGKTFSLTGWKVGWASGPAELVTAVEAAKNWLTYTSGSAFQPATAYALTHELDFPRRLAGELQAKRDRLCAGLATLDVDVHVPQGTYFVVTDVARYGWEDSLAFCRALPERAGVVAVPCQGFYDDAAEGAHKVRWTFCKKNEVIDEALQRLAEADLHR
ncbi:putative succinyldiaminopimelate transaminase DapC [Nocardioides mangrovicus]|uniref:Putative succinyldiaminopimelate transaminase DapC n=1 Tax=Nocardioides mangrovicus TaxID=2478913 RepID=A0A3L8NZS9_9ACTN|nr:pyridoxal phosphate-dependent aminotransferase [Nocardioides mangrovicus]RLV47809.1 putative succinyldiaminopimelate transaminase DapC [Nocardioides mangrovicus]